MSRWKGRAELWLEKTGQAEPFEGNAFTRWGEALEPVIRQAYAERTGRAVRQPRETVRHAAFAWMLCHPDGVSDDGRLQEFKNTRNPDNWGDEGTDNVPVE